MPTTLLDPQGQARDIPDDQVQAAIKAGGKPAIKITDPQGTPRWIPEDQKDAAIKAGGKIADDLPKGPLSSFAEATGLNKVGPENLVGIVNPGAAASNAARGLFEEGKRVYEEAKAGLKATDWREQQRHFTAATPFIGKSMDTAGKQVDQGDYSGAAGTFAGILANEFGLEAAGNVAGKISVPEIAEGVKGAASAVKDRVYPTSKSVTPPQAAARNLGKALVVPVQAMPNFVGAATEEAGTIKAYAKANNLPINSTVDLANAAEATAKAVQDHYNNQILAPNAKEIVSVPADYRGSKLNVEGSRATLSEVNNRINAINQELNPNYRKATQGQTSAANVSDADLLAEKRKLTSLLQDTLADKTGLEPEEIATLRQKAGKLRTIADEVRLSANTNTTAAGKAAMGRSDIPTGTKMGLVERGVQALRGGPEVIGNRAVNSAMRQIGPTDLVLPNPRVNPAVSPLANPVPEQVAAPPMVKPVYNEPLQEYIKRKKAARAQ